MGKVNKDSFGGSGPKLEQADLEEDAAILTIAEFEEVDVPDEDAEDGQRHSAVLRFVETGDKNLWLNKGMIEALIEQLGDESDDWAGKQCPVEKYVGRFGNKKFPKVRVMPAEEWPGAFKAANVKRKHPQVDAAPAPAVKGKKGK